METAFANFRSPFPVLRAVNFRSLVLPVSRKQSLMVMSMSGGSGGNNKFELSSKEVMKEIEAKELNLPLGSAFMQEQKLLGKKHVDDLIEEWERTKADAKMTVEQLKEIQRIEADLHAAQKTFEQLKEQHQLLSAQKEMLKASSTGGGDTCGDGGDNELGPILHFEDVMKEAETRGIWIPRDVFMAAESTGIPQLCLQRYLSMQQDGWGLGFAMRSSYEFRIQMMIDPWYPIRLGLKFAVNVIMDITAAIAMNQSGRSHEEIASYLLYGLLSRLFIHGFLAPLSYNYRRLRELQTSISQGFMRLFQHANRSLPASYSMFEVENDWCELHTRATYCTAAAISTALMVIFCLSKRNIRV